MYKQTELKKTLHKTSLGRDALIGAAIAFILIALFLAGAGAPNPEWPEYWMLRPLIIVPLAGAMGGVCYYILDFWRCQGGWKKIAANMVSVLVYVTGLWLGTVLGLVGTMWH